MLTFWRMGGQRVRVSVNASWEMSVGNSVKSSNIVGGGEVKILYLVPHVGNTCGFITEKERKGGCVLWVAKLNEMFKRGKGMCV